MYFVPNPFIFLDSYSREHKSSLPFVEDNCFTAPPSIDPHQSKCLVRIPSLLKPNPKRNPHPRWQQGRGRLSRKITIKTRIRIHPLMSIVLQHLKKLKNKTLKNVSANDSSQVSNDPDRTESHRRFESLFFEEIATTIRTTIKYPKRKVFPMYIDILKGSKGDSI